jgi:type VI secretion system secreted protein Hcp
MFQKNAAAVLVFLAAASLLVWVGSPVLATAGPKGDAVVSARSSTRHVALVKSSAGEISFPVLALSHEIVSPRDTASGLPTGKRRHKPFTFTHLIDKATPVLFSALIKGEPLSVEVTSFQRTGQRWTAFRTVRLDNAFVAAVGPWRSTSGDADDRPIEEVAFYYNRIAFHYSQSGTTVEDLWAGEFPFLEPVAE